MNVIGPEDFDKRSFAYRQISDAQYIEKAEGAMACSLKTDSDKQVLAAGLLDLSIISRTGFRGINVALHLQKAGFEIPEVPNKAITGDNGEMILRLSQKEFWVLNSLTKDTPIPDSFLSDNDAVKKINQSDLPQSDCYSLFCQDSHAWFMVTGNNLACIFAKICSVDLSEAAFPLGSIAQTSVARINGIVVRHMINSVPVFSVLSDSASAEYLWCVLLDAIQEFEGSVVSLNALNCVG
jgi:sarcosine oxidase subunit gamma